MNNVLSHLQRLASGPPEMGCWHWSFSPFPNQRMICLNFCFAHSPNIVLKKYVKHMWGNATHMQWKRNLWRDFLSLEGDLNVQDYDQAKRGQLRHVLSEPTCLLCILLTGSFIWCHFFLSCFSFIEIKMGFSSLDVWLGLEPVLLALVENIVWDFFFYCHRNILVQNRSFKYAGWLERWKNLAGKLN